MVLDNIEVLVHKHSVALDVVQCLPDHVRLVEEALVGDQEVQDGPLLAQGGEVIVTEEDGQLTVLHYRVQLADPERQIW